MPKLAVIDPAPSPPGLARASSLSWIGRRQAEPRDDQANLSASQPQPGSHPWFPGAHGHPQRPQNHCRSSSSGPQAARHQNRRQVSRAASSSRGPSLPRQSSRICTRTNTNPGIRAPAWFPRTSADQTAARVSAGPTAWTQASRSPLHGVCVAASAGPGPGPSSANSGRCPGDAHTFGHHRDTQGRQRRGPQSHQAVGPRGVSPTPSSVAAGAGCRVGGQTTGGGCQLRRGARRLRGAAAALGAHGSAISTQSGSTQSGASQSARPAANPAPRGPTGEQAVISR